MSSLFSSSSSSFLSCHILLFLLIALFVCLTPVHSTQANSVRRLGNDTAKPKDAKTTTFPNEYSGIMMASFPDKDAADAAAAAINSAANLDSLKALASIDAVKAVIPADKLDALQKVEFDYLKGVATVVEPKMPEADKNGKFGVFIRFAPVVGKDDDEKLSDKQKQAFKDNKASKEIAGLLGGKVFSKDPLPDEWKAEKDINKNLKGQQMKDLAAVYDIKISSASTYSRFSISSIVAVAVGVSMLSV
eukprot:GHVS01094812.1.p1 GENE.GHVS01094812.1~~GHVS01094812.1.p1  ORF type:complete len:247 (+),score=58.03 GHVS01094812.1:548-1288(+)